MNEPRPEALSANNSHQDDLVRTLALAFAITYWSVPILSTGPISSDSQILRYANTLANLLRCPTEQLWAVMRPQALSFIEPMQVLPVRELPDDGNWTYEAKLDGYRCLVARRKGGPVSGRGAAQFLPRGAKDRVGKREAASSSTAKLLELITTVAVRSIHTSAQPAARSCSRSSTCKSTKKNQTEYPVEKGNRRGGRVQKRQKNDGASEFAEPGTPTKDSQIPKGEAKQAEAELLTELKNNPLPPKTHFRLFDTIPLRHSCEGTSIGETITIQS